MRDIPSVIFKINEMLAGRKHSLPLKRVKATTLSKEFPSSFRSYETTAVGRNFVIFEFDFNRNLGMGEHILHVCVDDVFRCFVERDKIEYRKQSRLGKYGTFMDM